jgi:hypothetical protein
MESDPPCYFIKVGTINNIRFDASNNTFQLVTTQLDALNDKIHHDHSRFENFGDKFQKVNTKLDEFSKKLQY